MPARISLSDVFGTAEQSPLSARPAAARYPPRRVRERREELSRPRRVRLAAVRRSRVFTRINSSFTTVSPVVRIVTRTTSNDAISAATDGGKSLKGRNRPAAPNRSARLNPTASAPRPLCYFSPL
jgi:hypothetical protein